MDDAPRQKPGARRKTHRLALTFHVVHALSSFISRFSPHCVVPCPHPTASRFFDDFVKCETGHLAQDEGVKQPHGSSNRFHDREDGDKSKEEEELVLWLHRQHLLTPMLMPPMITPLASQPRTAVAPSAGKKGHKTARAVLHELRVERNVGAPYMGAHSALGDVAAVPPVPVDSWSSCTRLAPSGDALLLPSLEDLMPLVCSGELLCDVASCITSTPLTGVFRPPLTATTALLNIRKASERLRSSAGSATLIPEASSEECDRRLLEGDRMLTLKWLQSARLCARGR